jgi:hypothetical protein
MARIVKWYISQILIQYSQFDLLLNNDIDILLYQIVLKYRM